MYQCQICNQSSKSRAKMLKLVKYKVKEYFKTLRNGLKILTSTGKEIVSETPVCSQCYSFWQRTQFNLVEPKTVPPRKLGMNFNHLLTYGGKQ